LFEGKGRCAVADDGLDIKAAADTVERFFVDVDNSDVVAGNGGKVLGDGRTDLAAAEDEYFHGNLSVFGKNEIVTKGRLKLEFSDGLSFK